MKIVTIGAGYVGLVSGVCLSEIGHEVICVDKSSARIAALKEGKSPIYEPGLEEMMARNVAKGALGFSEDLKGALVDAGAVFICVGTPEDPATGKANLSYVFAAARELAHLIEPGTVIVTKSTVPVGTNEKVAEVIFEEDPNALFEVVSNPEFLREGSAIGDFMEPDRIVVGVAGEVGRWTMSEIYAPLVAKGHVLMTTDLQSAELIKYASNAFLATKITFINEIARLCEKCGADVGMVARGMGLDERIGSRFLRPGPGYGGSCFPKDTSALAAIGREYGAPLAITEATMVANEDRKKDMVAKVVDLFAGDLKGKRIAVFGVTFKPETDDMRAAPALSILPELHAMGAEVCIVDPEGREEATVHFPWAEWAQTPVDAARESDAVVLLTEWQMFKDLDLASISEVMRTPLLADMRNIYSVEAAREAGFKSYRSIGRVGY